MPHRPKKKVPLGKRPAWNTESDYYVREHRRLQLIEAIRQQTGNMKELQYECPGCDHKIWEARKGDTIFRGCHCHTVMLPPGHALREFDLDQWAKATQTNGQILQMTSSPPDKGMACIRTLARIHPTIRDDPFAMLKGALTSIPQPLGFTCSHCQKPVRRGFTQPELTGFSFSLFACGCTGESRLTELGDPTSEQWGQIVTEAGQLKPGQVKVRSKIMDEPTDEGGLN
jgi:hypothetical protein